MSKHRGFWVPVSGVLLLAPALLGRFFFLFCLRLGRFVLLFACFVFWWYLLVFADPFRILGYAPLCLCLWTLMELQNVPRATTGTCNWELGQIGAAISKISLNRGSSVACFACFHWRGICTLHAARSLLLLLLLLVPSPSSSKGQLFPPCPGLAKREARRRRKLSPAPANKDTQKGRPSRICFGPLLKRSPPFKLYLSLTQTAHQLVKYRN